MTGLIEVQKDICIEIMRGSEVIYQKIVDNLELAVNKYNEAVDKRAKIGDIVKVFCSGSLLMFEEKRQIQPEKNYGRRKDDAG